MTMETISREQLKKLINADNWAEIGRVFDFTPEFHFDGGRWIDWRCVPSSVVLLLNPNVVTKENVLKKLERRDDQLRNFEATGFEGKRKNNGASKSNRNRNKTYQRQKAICHYCGQKIIFAQWTIDHRQPRSRGGVNDEFNRVGACAACNHTKACLTDLEFFQLSPGTAGIGERAKQKVKDILNLRVDGKPVVGSVSAYAG